jgi:hypothetical protein
MVERYMGLLERVISLYRTNPDVRAFFRLGPEEESLVRADTSLTPAIRIARLDGYIAQSDGKIRFLENNTDCPAGILFTERLNRLVDSITESTVARAGVKVVNTPLDKPDCARQELIAAYRAQGGDESNPVIAVLQIKDKSNVESREMAKEFSDRGTPTFIADPREAIISSTGVYLEGKKVDLIWNKVNTVYWNQLAADSPSLLGRWADVIASQKVCHVNSFGARYVTESKLCAAFLQEPEFGDYFEDSDREFLRQVLPWSRKVEPGKRVDYEGQNWDISKLLLSRQSDFVLKQQYDIRGDGVTVGRSVDRDQWVERVKRAAREGHTAQEFIAGQAYPVMTMQAGMNVTPMTASLDSFVFGGRLAGLGSKAGPGFKVNLFQGGVKLAVRAYSLAQENLRP